MYLMLCAIQSRAPVTFFTIPRPHQQADHMITRALNNIARETSEAGSAETLRAGIRLSNPYGDAFLCVIAFRTLNGLFS